MILLASIVVVGIVFLKITQDTKPADTNNVSNEIVRISEATPSEANVPDNYSVAEGDPLKISIESVGIEGFIQKVGVDQNLAVAAPNNVNLAGWFVDSMLPGQKGLSIIDGHVSGRTKDGVFKQLAGVKTGDIVIVTMGGGKEHKYKVFATNTVPHEQAAQVLFDQDPKVTSQLNLITCTGQFDRQSETYADRVIVYAELINN